MLTPDHLLRLREWERTHLPHYGSDAGYRLFLILANSGEREIEMLKEFYLSLQHAESTIRLLLRNLESDGWIEIPRNEEDRRARKFMLTDKFHQKKEEWLSTAAMILGAPPEIDSLAEGFSFGKEILNDEGGEVPQSDQGLEKQGAA